MSQKINKIFIVDDDEMLAEMLIDHLSSYNLYKLKKFDTGEMCLKNLHENPDLIILDFNLNSKHKEALNGLQIIEEIKKVNKEIYIILYSSQELYEQAVNVFDNKYVHFIIKDEHTFIKIEQVIGTL